LNAALLGAWRDWSDVERLMVGKPIYMEISFALDFLHEDPAVARIFAKHPPEYILFETDSPWTAQDETLALLKSLGLGENTERRILRENALTLLQSQ